MKISVVSFLLLFTISSSYSQSIKWGTPFKMKMAGCVEYLGMSKGEHYMLKSPGEIKENHLKGSSSTRGGSGISFEISGPSKLGIVNLGSSFQKSELTEFTVSYNLVVLYEAFVNDGHLYCVYKGEIKKNSYKIIIETISLSGVFEKKQEIEIGSAFPLTQLVFSPDRSSFAILKCNYPVGDDNIDEPVIKQISKYTLKSGVAELKEEANVTSLNVISKAVINNAADVFFISINAGNMELCKGIKNISKVSLGKLMYFDLNLEFFEKENKLAIAALTGWAKNKKVYAEEAHMWLFNNASNGLDYSASHKIEAQYFTEKGKNGVKSLVSKKLFLTSANELVNLLQREELTETTTTQQGTGGAVNTRTSYSYTEYDALVLKTNGTSTSALLIPQKESFTDAQNPRVGLGAGYVSGSKLILLFNKRKGNDYNLCVASIDLSTLTFKEEQNIEMEKEHEVFFENKKFFDTQNGIFFIGSGGSILNKKYKVGVLRIQS